MKKILTKELLLLTVSIVIGILTLLSLVISQLASPHVSADKLSDARKFQSQLEVAISNESSMTSQQRQVLLNQCQIVSNENTHCQESHLSIVKNASELLQVLVAVLAICVFAQLIVLIWLFKVRRTVNPK